METFSALLALCAGNSPISGEFPRPVTRSFDVFFDMRLIKRLSKHSRGWWFQMLSRPLWRHCNDNPGWSHYQPQCSETTRHRLYVNARTPVIFTTIEIIGLAKISTYLGLWSHWDDINIRYNPLHRVVRCASVLDQLHKNWCPDKFIRVNWPRNIYCIMFQMACAIIIPDYSHMLCRYKTVTVTICASWQSIARGTPCIEGCACFCSRATIC